MKYALIITLSLIALTGSAQDKQSDLIRVADDLVSIENEDDESELESRYENLTLLLQHPIDLNKVNADDLRQFYFLNESQIQTLLRYRNEHGSFVSVYELQAVEDLDQNTISLLAPLVKVVANESLINTSLAKRMLSRGNSYLITRWEKTLEEKAGYRDSSAANAYQGSDQKIFMRFRSAIPSDYSVGITLEKDAGETIQWNPRKRKFGGDYSSAHLQLINKGRLRNLIAGDYQAQFAQGLVLGGAFGLGKSAETITTTRRTTLGFLPHTSAGESGFYRGFAATYELMKNLRMSAFVSHIKRDASISVEEEGKTITAFQYSGFHRNESEIARERNATETVSGAVVHYNRKQFDGGLIVQQTSFEHPMERIPNSYNQFAFSGRSNLNASIFYNYTINNFCFFGEIAKTHRAGSAIVTGAIGSLTPAFDISILYRNYRPDYYLFYGNAFSENTQPQNETGIYWGVKYKFNRRWTAAGYFDMFRFPWLAFRRYGPTYGHEWLGRVTFSPSRKITLFAQARQENKSRNTADESIQYIVKDGLKSNFWASVAFSEGALRMRTRVQYSTYRFNGKTSDGIVLLQGIGAEFGKFQVTGHYALFETDDFDNRQYVYENDVYLVFSLPFYDGTGTRSILMLQYSFSKHLSVYVRYSRSYFSEREEIGSGPESIHGNTKNDVKFQVVLRF